jgi:putative oxidoreductase
MADIAGFVTKTFTALEKRQSIPILLARLAMGYEFASSGFGKVSDLPKLTKYFVELGIPAPGANAAFTAVTELVCGVLLLLGLGTRFAAAPLTVLMTVAIFTAQIKEKQIHGLGDFLYLSEVAFVVIFVWLIFSGGGDYSLDALIAKKRRAPEPPRAA